MASLPDQALVIDAGIGWRLFVPHPQQAALTSQLSAMRSAGFRILAPTLWRYELTSILSKALHFKQLTTAEVHAALQLSLVFPIVLMPPDTAMTIAALAWTLRLHRAASYDSYYLALAQQLGCQFWTVDRKLANAVAAPWVRHVGDSPQ